MPLADVAVYNLVETNDGAGENGGVGEGKGSAAQGSFVRSVVGTQNLREIP